MAAEILLSVDFSMVDLKSISAALKLMDNESSNLLLSKLQHKLKQNHQLM